MIDPELLKILRCPETRQVVSPAAPAVVESLNARIASGELRNRAGHPVTEKLQAGLIRSDGQYLYPVRQNIPVMLIDEAITLHT